MLIVQVILGITVMIFLGWALSERREGIHWKRVGMGLVLQLLLAGLLLHVSWMQHIFTALNRAALILNDAAQAGSHFVFGYLSNLNLPFAVQEGKSGWIMAFSSLPIIIVTSALSSLLFYWKILPALVKVLAYGLQKTMHMRGALGLGVTANIFMGMVESPLIIRPYIKDMTRNELFSLMVCGLATIAGTVLVLYSVFLQPILDNALQHIVTASLISCPAALLFAELMIPAESTMETAAPHIASPHQSSMEALCAGIDDGIKIFISIIGTLLVFVALTYLVNQILAVIPFSDTAPLTLQGILGWILTPFMWLLGIPWEECQTAGTLMGVKIILNELLAYLDMASLAPGTLSPRSILIMTYAMCGFANLGSLGILLGGLIAMAPERAQEIRAFGTRSLLAGNLATCMTGSVIALLSSW